MRPTLSRITLAALTCVLACATPSSEDDPATGGLDGGAELPEASIDATAVADAAAGDAADGATADSAPEGCAPVKRFTFTSTAAVPLGCDANAPAVVLDLPLPATGRAVGRAEFDVRLAGGSVIHFWNLRVALGAPELSHGLGDDLCPGTTSHRSNLGLGDVTAANNHARLVGHAGAAPCTPGAVSVLAGAKLDVWVEDPRAACRGKDIAVGSWYAAKGFTAYHEWTTSMAPLPGAAANLTTVGASEKMRVIAVVEGSPAQDPNTTCGAEAATLVMQTTLDGALMATTQNVVPASQGQGHLVLFTSGDGQEIRSVTPGAHTAGMLVGSNFVGSVRTGGCCGDGSVALIRER
jgi:hypothetical protein